MNSGALMATEFHGQSDRPVGAPRPLFTIAGSGGGPFGFGRSYAVTPDGQRVIAIVSATDPTPHPASVILNWRAALEKRR